MLIKSELTEDQMHQIQNVRLESELSDVGGTSIMYKGYHNLLQREVAVKLLRECDDNEIYEVFINEKSILEKLPKFPNLVSYIESGTTQND